VITHFALSWKSVIFHPLLDSFEFLLLTPTPHSHYSAGNDNDDNDNHNHNHNHNNNNNNNNNNNMLNNDDVMMVNFLTIENLIWFTVSNKWLITNGYK